MRGEKKGEGKVKGWERVTFKIYGGENKGFRGHSEEKAKEGDEKKTVISEKSGGKRCLQSQSR